MSLITDIQTIITRLYPTATQILSSKFQANVHSFSLPSTLGTFIIIDNEQPKTPEIKKNNNVIKDTKILISFLKLDDTNNTDVQTQALIDATEAMADRVAVNIYQLLPVRPTGNQRYKITPMFRVFNSVLSGTALEMQVFYNEVINFTLPEPEGD